MPGMLMSERPAMSVGSDFSCEPIQRLPARGSEMHHVGSLAGFAAEPLAKQVGDIGFIINDKNAHAQDAASAIVVW
jgi:hypothetical protein